MVYVASRSCDVAETKDGFHVGEPMGSFEEPLREDIGLVKTYPFPDS